MGPIHPVWVLAAILVSRAAGCCQQQEGLAWQLESSIPNPSHASKRILGPLRISAENFAYFGFWGNSEFSLGFDDFC